MYCATFSIVAFDSETNSWGVAVASKFLAVGAYVPYAQAEAGAIATQAQVNINYGASGLARLRDGMSAHDVLHYLVAGDSSSENRQVGIVDRVGGSVSHTGHRCLPWAGGVTGQGFAIQGNVLSGPHVIAAMYDAFVASSRSFANRLLAALAAGDLAGGDRRGKQSAAILIVKAGAGYGGNNDRWLDLRVDDSEHPIPKLAQLVTLHDLYFGKSTAPDKLPLSGSVLTELQELLRAQGYVPHAPSNTYDAETAQALRAFTGTENLEERIDLEDALIDKPALEYLRSKFSIPPTLS